SVLGPAATADCLTHASTRMAGRRPAQPKLTKPVEAREESVLGPAATADCLTHASTRMAGRRPAQPKLTESGAAREGVRLCPFGAACGGTAFAFNQERRLAERVGFEPTCRLRGKTLSRRPRYDHFGTSPHRGESRREPPEPLIIHRGGPGRRPAAARGTRAPGPPR